MHHRHDSALTIRREKRRIPLQSFSLWRPAGLPTSGVLALAACFGNGSCKMRAQSTPQPYIIGSDDIELVQSDDQGSQDPATAADAGQLLSSVPLIVQELENAELKFCSGAVMDAATARAAGVGGGERIVVTNHHCFKDETQAAGKQGEETPEASLLDTPARLLPCARTQVVFGHAEGSLDSSEMLPCKDGSLKVSAALDLARFIIPDAGFVGDGFPLATEGAGAGTRVMIIHYPNLKRNLAGTRHFRHALPKAAVTAKNCALGGTFDERFADPILRYGIRHDCDLTHGSSGSALLAATGAAILGINWGGVRYTDAGQEVEVNVATAAAYVRQFLGDDETIAALDANPAKASARGKQETASSQPGKKAIQCGTVNTTPRRQDNDADAPGRLALVDHGRSFPVGWSWSMAQLAWIDAASYESNMRAGANGDQDRQLASRLIFLDLMWKLQPQMAWMPLVLTGAGGLEEAASVNGPAADHSAGLAKMTVTKLRTHPLAGKTQLAKDYLSLAAALNRGELTLPVFTQSVVSLIETETETAPLTPPLSMLPEKTAAPGNEPEPIPSELARILLAGSQPLCVPVSMHFNSQACKFWLAPQVAVNGTRHDRIYLKFLKVLGKKQYPLVLRHLYQRQKNFKPDRLLYDKVQSIFARSQRGSGQVALDQL